MMRARCFVLIIVVLTVGSTAASQGGQRADASLGAALHLEQVAGDLEGAIAAYREILSQPGVDRAIAAEAQYRLGVCHEKLGQAVARAAYERVLSDYAEQTAFVSAARERLAALDGPAVPAITLRQIMSGGQDAVAVLSDVAITPDGRRLIYTDWDTGNFELRDLATNRVRMLRLRPESEETPEGSSEGPVVSADGEWVAYAWYDWDLGRYDLRIIRLDGTESRILYDDETVEWTYPWQWSTDGQRILAGISRKDQRYDIALISVQSGDIKVLKTLDRGVWPIGEVLSPDQRFVAYSRPVETGSENWDVYLLPTDGSPEIPLVQHPAEDYVLGWTPDGRYVLFASRRRGTLGVFLQPVEEGEPAGEAQMVKADMWRVAPLGFTRDGSFYYTQDTSIQDVYVAEIDFDAGTVVSPPAPLFQSRYEGPNLRPIISPDGKYLASIGRRGPEAWWYANKSIVSIHSFETGETRRLNTSSYADPRTVFWTASGDSLVVVGRDPDRDPCLYRASATTGQMTTWECRHSEEIGPGIVFGVSLNGARIYYTQGLPDGIHILARNPDTGTEEELKVIQAPRSVIALSPDGLQIAFREDTELQELMVMPSSGGEARRIASAPDSTVSITSIAFLPDDRGLVFSLRSEEDREQLWYVPLDGGKARPLPLEMESLWSLAVHPDGRRLFFVSRQQSAELWMMEGFLPSSSSQQ